MEGCLLLSNDKRGKCSYLSNTFLSLFECYANERFKDPITELEYWNDICSLCNYAKKDFLQLTFTLVQGYFSSISTTTSLGTRKNRMRVYLAVARYADKNALFYHIDTLLTSAFQTVTLEEQNIVYQAKDLPSLKDIDCVLDYFKKTGDMVMFIAVALALCCSLPTSELISLKKEMFFQDLSGRYGIRISISNTNDRFVKVPDDIAQLIIKYAESRNDTCPYLLLNAYSKPLGARTLQNRLLSACKACDVIPFTMLGLRVLGTTLMLKGDAPLDKVAEHINVKKKDWFFRYNRVVKELDNSAVDYIHLKIVW